MIDKSKNVRIFITISKKQYDWLSDFSKKKHLTKSKLISWLLAKKTKDVIDTLNLNTHPQEEVKKIEDVEPEVTDEELNKMFEYLEKNRKIKLN